MVLANKKGRDGKMKIALLLTLWLGNKSTANNIRHFSDQGDSLENTRWNVKGGGSSLLEREDKVGSFLSVCPPILTRNTQNLCPHHPVVGDTTLLGMASKELASLGAML